MREITSIKNQEIISICKLREKKYRKETQSFIIEGEKMIKESLALGKSFEMIYTTNCNYEFLNYDSNITIVSDCVMRKISDTVSPQGIVGILKIPTYQIGSFDRCVILDNIQDAGNLGTIIRTMAATSIEYIFMHNCVDIYNPKTVRSSMGGIHFVKPFEVNTSQIIELIKSRNIPLIVADMHGQDVFNSNLDKFALVVGNEAHGVSSDFKKATDLSVSIKMHNIESLNAGVATSIILYTLINKSGGN